MATTLHPPAAIYREEQNFAWWVYALLALMVTVGVLTACWFRPDDPAAAPDGLDHGVPLALAVGLVLPAILIVGVLRMTTEVTPLELRVWFGWLPTYRKAVPIDQIRALEVVRYRPIAECGGWGIRNGPDGERVLNARGDRGVRIVLEDGSRLLIGSQRPEDLALALEQARRPVR